jgi:Xaa-Pro aminopeptidase
MDDYFSSDFFASNRRSLRASVKDNSVIVITANGQLQRSGDSSFSFAQDANFWYLTGLDESDFVLVIEKESEYLIMPERSRVQNLFEGSVSESELTIISGISDIMPARLGFQRLSATLADKPKVSTLAASAPYIKVIGMYTNPARARLIQKLKRMSKNLEITYIGDELAKMRVIKQAPEIKAIRRAVDITCQAFSYVQSQKYSYEYQLEADLSKLFRSSGAIGHGYDPIVAADDNACTLHYSNNQAKIAKGSVVLVDAGAEYGHYSADITRTWSIGPATARQQAVIEAVSETLEYGLGLLRPGVSFRDCEQEVRKYTGRKLKDLGLIKDASDTAAIAHYYPHSPHYLGLNVHDVGDYKQPLAPGMVLTLEPGIYIPDEHIGVRIEDDILITETGHELLSQQLPHTQF